MRLQRSSMVFVSLWFTGGKQNKARQVTRESWPNFGPDSAQAQIYTVFIYISDNIDIV